MAQTTKKTRKRAAEFPKLAQLFAGSKLALENEGKYFSTLSDHQGAKGRLNESHLKTVLRRHLPEKYGIGTGFIVSSKTINKTDNPQIDIIIYDRINNAPLYQSEAFGIYPIECVYAYIEVKTTLTTTELRKSLNVNADIRKIASGADKVYVDIGADRISPRFYIFSYKSSPKNKNKLEKNILSEFESQGKAHAHGIYILDKGILLSRKALNDENLVDFDRWDGDLSFATFILNLKNHLETMIPRLVINENAKMAISTGLPYADTTRYLRDAELT